MQDFVYLFELFTILMGLAVAEMLRGFSGVMKLRARRKAGIDINIQNTRIGWLVPLLGIFVLVDLATFWLLIYEVRNTLPFNFASVISIIGIIGAFYMVASLVFPDEPELWKDFDDYYWQLKRFVILGVFFINIVAQTGVLFLGFDTSNPPEYLDKYPILLWTNLLVIIGIPWMVWAALSKSKKLNYTFLIYYIITHLAFGVVTAIVPPYTEGMAL